MDELQIMEQNLAKLIHQHQVPPQEEPADPFQKKQFGRKMRSSAIDLPRHASLNALHPTHTQPHPTHSLQQEQPTTDPEQQHYLHEVEALMARLKVSLHRVEEGYKERVVSICQQYEGVGRQNQVDNLLSSLEGSIEFILNDCLTFNERPNRDKRDRDNREFREAKEAKEVKEVKEGRELRELKEKERLRDSRDKQNNCRRNTTTSQTNQQSRCWQKPQKSVYESVLQQRRLRNSKRRM